MLNQATTSRSLHARRTAAVLSALSAAMIYVLVAPSSAHAVPSGPNCATTWNFRAKKAIYTCQDPGQTGKPAGARAAGQPPCDLTGTGTYCVGSSSCFLMTNPDPSIFHPPTSPPPSPDATWAIRLCTSSSSDVIASGAVWIQNTPASQQVAARQAIGNLQLPHITAASAPPTQTLVNLDTWFAPNRPITSPIRGTSALGVIAVATITGLAVDPGDSTPAFTCPPAVTLNATAGCNHTYRRSSATQTATTPDGKPGYTVRTWTTWNITFLQGNTPITIPGAPTTVDGPTTTRILPVAEVQTIVTN